ncbi:MAG: hypothetical protein FWD06_10680 [Oscillospiraceae bacterium]|nr:hypothetical protein [Oscillospiraceae bacterium]
MNNPYAEFYEHIKAFETHSPMHDDWDDFIASIKKQVLLKQIEYAKNN